MEIMAPGIPIPHTRAFGEQRELGPPQRTTELWQQFSPDHSQMSENIKGSHALSFRRNQTLPCFKQRIRNNRFRSRGNHAKPADVSEHAGRVARMEQLWQEFFVDPSQWWDNRCTKRRPKDPDFKHKATLEGLWVVCGWNPPWVKTKFANFFLDQLECNGGLVSRVTSLVCDDDKMRELCQEGQFREALRILKLMIQQTTEGLTKAFVYLLKGCAKRRALAEGKQVHALMIQCRCDYNTFLANNLVEMYSKCGSMLDALKVFVRIPRRNVFSWTAIISACADNGHGKEAIMLFQQMRKAGISPDKVLFVIALKACARISALDQGKQLHADIRNRGLESDVIIQSALVYMYAKCGRLEDACKVFDNMNERNIFAYTMMIGGYRENGSGKEAIALYEQMKQEGVQPNKVTLIVALKACASIGALEKGKQLHADIKRRGFELDEILQSTLVDMYAKCGCLTDAREVFTNMSKRDVVSWTVMIGGYVQNGLGKEALLLYEQMRQEHILPDILTFVLLLKACAIMAVLEQGKQLHSDLRKRGLHTPIFTKINVHMCHDRHSTTKIISKIVEISVSNANEFLSQGWSEGGLKKV